MARAGRPRVGRSWRATPLARREGRPCPDRGPRGAGGRRAGSLPHRCLEAGEGSAGGALDQAARQAGGGNRALETRAGPGHQRGYVSRGRSSPRHHGEEISSSPESSVSSASRATFRGTRCAGQRCRSCRPRDAGGCLAGALPWRRPSRCLILRSPANGCDPGPGCVPGERLRPRSRLPTGPGSGCVHGERIRT